jgi:alpha 1,6-mannosyltransferase
MLRLSKRFILKNKLKILLFIIFCLFLFNFIVSYNYYYLDKNCYKLTETPNINPHNIPITLHFTSPSYTQLTDWILLSWQKYNPHYTINKFTDATMDLFVKDHVEAEFYDLYTKFVNPVLRADFFRYLVVYELGGVYSDIDTICRRPVDNWHDQRDNVNMILGIEWLMTDFQIVQWTFAAKAKNPILGKVVEAIKKYSFDKMKNGTFFDFDNMEVLYWTGPKIWTNVVLEYWKEEGLLKDWNEFRGMKSGRMIGDTLLLPIEGFNSGEKNEEMRVQHLYWSSWLVGYNRPFFAEVALSLFCERKIVLSMLRIFCVVLI